MEYITLNNGIQMPIIGFGTWAVRGKEGYNTLLDAIHTGYPCTKHLKKHTNKA